MKLSIWNEKLAQATRHLYDEFLKSGVEKPPGIKSIALRAGGLPVYCDIGGCLMITPQGVVLEYDWNDGTFAPTKEDHWRKTAQARAAEEFEELRALRDRPAGAQDCKACQGTGKLGNPLVAKHSRCAECGGLGFEEPGKRKTFPFHYRQYGD